MSGVSRNLPKNYIGLFEVAKDLKLNIDQVKYDIGKNAHGLAGIKEIPQLRPISHLFKEFEKGEMRKTYAILRSHYEYFKRTGEAPKVSTGRPPRWKNNPDYDNLNIPIPKALYNEFKQVVNNANAMSVTQVTYRDMIYVALTEFIQRRPQLKGGANNE